MTPVYYPVEASFGMRGSNQRSGTFTSNATGRWSDQDLSLHEFRGAALNLELDTEEHGGAGAEPAAGSADAGDFGIGNLTQTCFTAELTGGFDDEE